MVAGHGVEDGEEFADDGDDGGSLGFPCGHQHGNARAAYDTVGEKV